MHGQTVLRSRVANNAFHGKSGDPGLTASHKCLVIFPDSDCLTAPTPDGAKSDQSKAEQTHDRTIAGSETSATPRKISSPGSVKKFYTRKNLPTES